MDRDEKQQQQQQQQQQPTRPNGRTASFTINKEGRKPLFSAPSTLPSSSTADPNHAVLTDAGPAPKLPRPSGLRQSLSPSSTPPSGQRHSQIPKPRPSSGASLKDAWGLAMREYERERRSSAEGSTSSSPPNASPSPAPRPRPQQRPPIRDTELARVAGRALGDITNDRNKQPVVDAEDGPAGEAVEKKDEAPRSSVFRTSRIGPLIAETGETLVRKSIGEDGGGIGGTAGAVSTTPRPRERVGWTPGVRATPNWLRKSTRTDRADVNNGRETKDVPLPSIEDVEDMFDPLPPIDDVSPSKSYAWDIEDDFTAGDLQVSDSPMLKLDTLRSQQILNFEAHNENRAVGLGQGSPPKGQVSPPRQESPLRKELRPAAAIREGAGLTRTKNTKLAEIRARELAAEQNIPVPDRNHPRQKNTKLDEIRQREKDGLSRRTLAAIKLDELREVNAKARSQSPQSPQSQLPKPKAEARPSPHAEPQQLELNQLPTDPEMSYKPTFGVRKTSSEKVAPPVVTAATAELGATEVRHQLSLPHTHSANSAEGKAQEAQDSQDVLRQLARATSNSPAPDRFQPTVRPAAAPTSKLATAVTKSNSPDDIKKTYLKDDREDGPPFTITAATTTTNTAKTSKLPTPPEPRQPATRPTVGFLGLRRVRSTESTREKRASMPTSDIDPTERIEQEMKLFALGDNQSERGSIRAPSPKRPGSGFVSDSDDDDEDRNRDAKLDETPRAPRRDPLSMPTPRVVGAYVETPATVRAEPRDAAGSRDPPVSQPLVEARRPRVSRRAAHDGAVGGGSDPETVGARKGTSATEIPIAAPPRRRARSLPRRRQPLLNSARPPSVKDDILELQRIHHIEDSTLDDLEEILSGRRTAPVELKEPEPTIKPVVKKEEAVVKREREPVVKRERQLEVSDESASLGDESDDAKAMARMTRALQTGLIGIRTAKQGIERLEDRVAHSEKPLLEGKLHNTQHHDILSKRGTSGLAPKEADHRHCPTCTAFAHQKELRKQNHRDSRFAMKLYTSGPPLRLTLLGGVLLLLSLWLALESAVCARYCRPRACRAAPCSWDPDDPTWGWALPVKVDDWVLGGWGTRAVEGAGEAVHGLWEVAAGSGGYEDIHGSARTSGQGTKRRSPKEHDYDGGGGAERWSSFRAVRQAIDRQRGAQQGGGGQRDTWDVGGGEGEGVAWSGDDSFEGDEQVW